MIAAIDKPSYVDISMYLAVNLTSPITPSALTDFPNPLPAETLNTCTLHEPPSHRYSVDEILQIILRSRKTWKTLKGQSEAVWPPYLEATMLKGLQEYEPDDSRETRILGRYPMRNRFISDYIHRTTGKYRSAKQVGSRLQQLRDTAEGRELIDVLTRCYRTRMDAGTCNARVFESHLVPSNLSSSPSLSTISCDSSSTSSSSDFPVTSVSPVTMPRLPPIQSRQPTESRMPVYIDILPQPLPGSSSMGRALSSVSTPSASHHDPRTSDATRHIRDIDPNVTFASPSRVNGTSSYIVLLDGAPVHSEDTALVCAGYFSSHAAQAPGDVPVLYNTALVPKYWDVLCKSADPTLYTIVQEVYHVPDPVPNQNYLQRPRPVRIFSATYHFRYPSPGGALPMYGQPPVKILSSSSPTKPTFNDQTLHTPAPVDLARTTSFPAASMYTTPMAEGLVTPTGVDQNLFDEPFMLDVNFDQISFDEIFVNMDNTPDSTFSSSFFS